MNKLILNILKSIVLISFAVVFSISCTSVSDPKGIDINDGGEGGEKVVLEISGTVTDEEGQPLSNIVISDGYKCTQTDSKGKYNLKVFSLARYIFYSIPADADVTIGDDGLPCFYQKYSNDKDVYDFRIKKSDVKKQFRLLAIGDPQVKNEDNVKRFKVETVTDINKFLKKHDDMPTIAMSMGDLVHNTWNLFQNIKDAMNAKDMGVPVFQTVGNHDHEFPKMDDRASIALYEDLFGPANYSFNIGNVHVVSMDDVRHKATNSPDYEGGFEESQCKWLKEDLEYVDKSKTILLSVHIPFKNEFKGENKHRNDVLREISKFKKAYIIAGHTHNVNNEYCTKVAKIPEFILGTTCGAWWHGVICNDGAPNGYGVLEFDGTDLKNMYYKATRYPENYQMRMHWTTTEFMGGGTIPYYFNYKQNKRLIINAWASNSDWTFKAYEDGVESTNQIRRVSSIDAWAQSYFFGSEKLTSSIYANKHSHYYIYDVINPSAKIKIEAKDVYGNVYVCDKITGDDDYPSTNNYPDKY